jgi:hypothetical protein
LFFRFIAVGQGLLVFLFWGRWGWFGASGGDALRRFSYSLDFFLGFAGLMM